jgi:FkbM family methyltransferase
MMDCPWRLSGVAMMQSDNDPLVRLLKPARLTSVVDVGANPIDGDPPYKSMLQRRICRVIGFEPQQDALARLNSSKSDLEMYLPYALGEGGVAKLRVCRAPGMSSLFEPDEKVLSYFPKFSEWGQVAKELEVSTRRLDDISEVDRIDFLKIDVQGSELSIFKGGRVRLAQAIAIQSEVSFVPLYKKQPVFGEIDLELRAQGFVPHAFVNINKRMIGPLAGKDPFVAINQLLEADIVYVRDFMNAAEMDDEQLKHLAIVAHNCYRSTDLAMNCIHNLVQRKAVTSDAMQLYLAMVRPRAA